MIFSFFNKSFLNKRVTRAGLRRIEEFREDWQEIVTIYQFVTKGGNRYE